ncbi:uncharacterized protein LOC135471115 isoform X2 [Liolophura sinensis]|uniref:uncharacterized protein LOC135471115 isoform X2 n=1 Tax=Liolophura sinensis TaxID=3198878 RepID=UPI0031598785
MGGTLSRGTPGCRPVKGGDATSGPPFTLDSKDSSISARGSPWKFWRRFSLRRSGRKSSQGRLKSGKGGSIPTEPWATIEARHEETNLHSPCDRIQCLPDLVDKVGLRRSQSLKPPPKPPRLFLFRSSSISTPRGSLVDTSARNSGCFPSKETNEVFDDLICNNPPPVKDQSEQSTEVIDLSCTPKMDTSLEGQVNGEIDHSTILANNISSGNTNDTEKLSHNHYGNGMANHNGGLRVSPGRIKIVTPDLNSKKYSLTRNRKRSVDLKEASLSAPHRVILQCAEEIICQSLQPAVILEDLHSAGVITAGDLQAFTGHPDRRLICESLIATLTKCDYSQFLEFCDIIRRTEHCNSLSVMLDAMVAISDLLYNVREEAVDIGEPILEEEKTISFDIGIYDKASMSLKPIVELDRVKHEIRKSLREQTYQRQSSRLSGRSFSDCSPVRDPRTVDLPMMSVYISGYSLHGERSKALASVLDKHHCIHELRVGKTQLSGDDMENICLAIQNNPGLSILDVRLNSIENEGATRLGFMLRKSTNLRQLNISSTGIESVGCKYLCDGLMINAVLRELDLSFVDIGDEGCVHIAEMLTKNCSITKLRLRNNNITWVGCGLIFESLQENQTLADLDLSRNFVKDRGIEIMCQNVNKAPGLQDLNLENCGMTIEGCAYLAQTLVTNVTLKHLDLSVNFLGDQGVKRLSEILRRTKTLQSLGLNMCGITNDGLVTLLDSLVGNHSLTLLKLCYNRFGRESVSCAMDVDDIRFKMHCVTSSKPKLKILLWGNSLDDNA